MTNQQRIDFCLKMKLLYERAAKQAHCARCKKRHAERAKHFGLMIEKLSE